MIIRERSNEIVMMTQDDHAHISGICVANWKETYFYGKSMRESVERAITEHDRGWISVDAKPLWNDQTKLPFSFMDYPTKSKLNFYKKGIDEVVAMDAYAGLLCSRHYSRFTARDKGQEAQQFVRDEELRQNQLKKEIIDFNRGVFQFHYNLLTFCDNLSLYACLNEPGVPKPDEHYFFQQGLPVPPTFSFLSADQVDIGWQDEQTIRLSEFPFEEPFAINIIQKVVSKSQIKEQGLLFAYEHAPIEMVNVHFKSGP